jgi:4-carboxymuconolactone decarboxylase
MSRISLLDCDKLNNKQLTIYNKILGSRPSIAGPFIAWLHSPDFADKAQELGKFVRFDTTLLPKLSELAILLVARHWNCQNEWSIHEPFAVQAGLSRDIIKSLNDSSFVKFNDDKEKLIYNYTTELLKKQFISEETYSDIRKVFKEKTIVELTGLIGYYSLVALTLNAFQIPVPESVIPKLTKSPVF